MVVVTGMAVCRGLASGKGKGGRAKGVAKCQVAGNRGNREGSLGKVQS